MRHLNNLRYALFFCVPAALILHGCTAPQADAPFQPKLKDAYEADVQLEYGDGQSADLHLTRCGNALWDAAFTEPPALAGVILTFDGDTVSASYKGLAFTVPKTALPAKNMLGIVTEALDAAAAAESLPCTQSDGSWSYQGDCPGGSYTMTFAETGEPLVFDLPSQPLRLTFTGFTVTAQTSAETTVTQTDTSSAETTTAAIPADTIAIE